MAGRMAYLYAPIENSTSRDRIGRGCHPPTYAVVLFRFARSQTDLSRVALYLCRSPSLSSKPLEKTTEIGFR
jgi:hypothetical protein